MQDSPTESLTTSNGTRAGFLLPALAAFVDLPADEQLPEACVQQLVHVYDAAYAMIGVFADERHRTIRSIALWTPDGPGKPIRYALQGTPCQEVLDFRLGLFPSGVAKAFPEDRLLTELGIEAYLGAPLVDGKGRCHGIVVVMDTRPVRADAWLEPVLRLYAYRIALHLEQIESEQALRQAEAEYRSLFENLGVGIYRSTPDGRQLRANPALVKLNGYRTEAELLAAVNDIASEWYVDPARREDFKRLLDEHSRIDDFVSEVYRHANRERIWIRESAYRVLDEEGRIRYYEGTVQDITAQKRAEDALRASEARFRAMIENQHGITLILEREGAMRYISPGIERVLGYPVEEWTGRWFFDLVHPEDRDACYAEYQRVLDRCNKGQESEYRFRHRDGGWPVLGLLGNNCLDDPSIDGVVVNARDVSERYQTEQRIRQLAHSDAMTGLPNRLLLESRAGSAIAQARRDGNGLALLFIDLDRFKPINDTHGHAIGDHILRMVAERLQGVVRESDTVARIGGDEFAVLMPRINSATDAATLAAKLCERLTTPYPLGEHAFSISASIGISCFPDNGATFDVLLRNADLAMYQAKQDNRGGFRFFSDAMQEDAALRLRLSEALHRAVHDDQLVLYYQPQFDLQSGELVGLEALLRWYHPEEGLLLPERFIRLAEETGSILPLGRWVLETVCRQLRDWMTRNWRPPRVAVNFAVRQFNDDELNDWLGEICTACGVDPAWLEFEITDAKFKGVESQLRRQLDALHILGVRFAFEHFEGGSLLFKDFKSLPVSTVKIDRHLVQGLPDDACHAAAVRTLVALAENFELRLVAEGIETEAQARFLSMAGCREGQGYLLGPPLPAEQVYHEYAAVRKIAGH